MVDVVGRNDSFEFADGPRLWANAAGDELIHVDLSAGAELDGYSNGVADRVAEVPGLIGASE